MDNFFIIHPGETLKELLANRAISQGELAALTGASNKHIAKVIGGRTPISIGFAERLQYALDVKASFWINLQANYDKELIEAKKAKLKYLTS